MCDYNAFTCDTALQASLPADNGTLLSRRLLELGAAVGEQEWIDRGFKANENSPALKNFDRFGHRIDEVEFHPAYHQLMGLGMGLGIHCTAWTQPIHGHRARAAMQYLLAQLEPAFTAHWR